MTVHGIALVVAAVGALYWSAALALTLHARRKISSLGGAPPDAPAGGWPSVSVVIPACDEIGTIEPALARQLGSDYPELELIVVDDRSRDGTGALLDRLAASEERLRVLHVTPEQLPVGWLGKVHALHVGQAAASGRWLLFCDADVQPAPELLRHAIAHCEREGLDFLTALPRLVAVAPLLDAVVATTARTVFVGGQLWQLENPRSDKAGGFGAFILVRRAAWEGTEGFPWLKLDVADDLALGLLLKRSGARCAAVNASALLDLRFYGTLRELAASVEKGAYAIVGRFSLLRLLALSAAMPLLELAPFVGLIWWLLAGGAGWWPAAIGAVGLAAALATSAAIAGWFRLPWRTVALFWLGAPVVSALSVRSGLIGRRRGGISWRGTFYPAELLEQGMRARWP